MQTNETTPKPFTQLRTIKRTHFDGRVSYIGPYFLEDDWILATQRSYDCRGGCDIAKWEWVNGAPHRSPVGETV